MLLSCPHCLNKLQPTAAQQEKIKQALRELPTGKVLKISCPTCKESIHLNQADNLISITDSTREETATSSAAAVAQSVAAAVKVAPMAPEPPNITWLQSGKMVDEDQALKGDRLAMVLMTADEKRTLVTKALEDLDYQVEFPVSVEDAKKRMRFVNFAAVVFSSAFASASASVNAGASAKLEVSDFHLHMTKLPMAGRRLMLYILISPDFNTLYDLEALAYSANLVVNEKDLAQMSLILKKALQDYHDLFGSYLEALRAHHGNLG